MVVMTSSSDERRSRIGWLLLIVAVLAMGVALALWVLIVDEPLAPDIVLFPVGYLAFATVGAMILSRRPSNRIGRLAMATGLGGSLVGIADSYARQVGPAPGQAWAAWLAAVGFPATLGPIIFLLLLFPTGRLASPRWRIVAAVTLTGMVVVGLGNAFTPTFADYPQVSNPIGLPALQDSALAQGGVGWFLVVGGAVFAAGGLVPRLRRARGIERQQLKWMTYAAALHGISWIVLAIGLPGLLGEVAQYVLFITLTLIPVAAGIGILRYRLYDIDIVIRRTLTYGVLVAILTVVYGTLVLVSQALVSQLTGSDTMSVAASTLVIAALFRPVRSRVQAFIDRRFYRSRYDAQRSLDAFAGRLRNEVELDTVGSALLATANQAVQPASAAVWLRGSEAR